MQILANYQQESKKNNKKKEEKREKNVEKLQGLAVVMNYNFIQKSKRFSKSRKTQMKEAKKTSFIGMWSFFSIL